jgi:hypothetical protein
MGLVPIALVMLTSQALWRRFPDFSAFVGHFPNSLAYHREAKTLYAAILLDLDFLSSPYVGIVSPFFGSFAHSLIKAAPGPYHLKESRLIRSDI